MTDMIVAGAGTTAVNGTYAEYGTRNSKPRYRMASAASGTGYFYIVWSSYNMWHISIWGDSGSDTQIMIAARYSSTDAVATPDLVATWTKEKGDLPVPTVTAASSSQNLTLTCAAGSYALTGTNADLTVTRHYTLTCEAGSYALTGTDASLTSHRIFALGMGSYVLVGTSVGLFILSPTPACRTATIEFENRTFAIPHENRTATIEYENRTLEVKCH